MAENSRIPTAAKSAKGRLFCLLFFMSSTDLPSRVQRYFIDRSLASNADNPAIEKLQASPFRIFAQAQEGAGPTFPNGQCATFIVNVCRRRPSR